MLLYFYCYNRKHALYFVPCTCWFTFTPYSLYIVLGSLLLLLQQKLRLILCTLYLLVYFCGYNRKHALSFVPCTCCFTFTVTIEKKPYSLYLVLLGLHLLLQQKSRLIPCTLYLLVYFYCYNRKHAVFLFLWVYFYLVFFVPCTLVYFYCYNRKHALFFVPCTCWFTFTVTIENTPYLCTLFLLPYSYDRKHVSFVPCTCWFTFTVTIENTPYSLYLVLVALLLLLQQKTRRILCTLYLWVYFYSYNLYSCTLYLLLYFYCYNRKHALFFVPCTCCFTFTVTIKNTPYSLYLVLVGLLLLLQQKTRLILCTLYLLVYFYCYNRKHALFFVPCTCWFTFTATIETRRILCTLYLLVYIYCYNRKHALFFVPCTCWFTFTVTIENTPYSLYLVLVALLLLSQQKTRLILCTLYLFYCYNRKHCYKKHALFFVPCTCWFTFTVTIENTPYSLYLVLVALLLLLQQKTRRILCTLYLLVYFYCYNRKHALFFVPCTCWFTFTVTIENTPYSLYLVLVALLLLLQQKTLLILCTFVLVGFTFTVTIENTALFFVPCTCCFTFTVTIENTPYSLYLVLVGLLLLLQQKTRLILCTLYLLVYFYCYNRKHALFFVPCTCCFTFTVTIESLQTLTAIFFVPCTCWFTFTVTIENTPYSLYLVLVGLLLLLQQKTRPYSLYLVLVRFTCWFFTVTIENTPYSLYLVLVGLLLLLQQKTRLILCTLYMLVYFYCYNRKHALFFVPCTCWFTFTVTIENTPYSLYLVLVGLLLLLQQKTRLILCTLYLLLYFYCYNRKHALFFVPCTCWFTFTVTIENTPYSLYLVLVGLLLLLQQKTRLILCTCCSCCFTFTVTIENTPYSLYTCGFLFVPCTCWFTFTVTIENTPYSLYLVLVALLLLLQQKTRLILCTLYLWVYFYCYNKKTRLILCTLYLLVYFYCYNRKHALFFVPCTCWFTFTVKIENTPYSLYIVLVALLLLLQQKLRLIPCTLYLLV